MVLGLCLHGQYVVALVFDLAEELLLVFPGVEIVHHADQAVVSVLLLRNIERGGNDDLVILFHLAVDGHIDLSVLSFHLLDDGVQAGRVLKMLVQGLPDELGAVLPGPEVDLDEVHAGLEIQIFKDIGGRDLVEIAIAEGGEGADPDVLDQFHSVLLAELGKRHCQVLEVGIDAAYRLSFGAGCGEAFVAALCHAPVAVEVVAFILGLQKLSEFLELSLHLQETGDLQDVLSGLEGLDDLAQTVLIVAVELGAVMGDAAEFLHVMHGIIGRNAHDGAHLITAAVIPGRPALAAYPVVLLQDGIVLIPLLLQIHTCGKACGSASDDTDSDVFIHVQFPPVKFFEPLLRGPAKALFPGALQ